MRQSACIPTPRAAAGFVTASPRGSAKNGDAACGDGPRFFQSSIDIKSTQPLEQFLGTLGQTTGYQPTDVRGGEPWSQELRQAATKTVVVVSDDNSRLSANDFETFAGGPNP